MSIGAVAYIAADKRFNYAGKYDIIYHYFHQVKIPVTIIYVYKWKLVLLL